MVKLLKRIADLILACVALLGLLKIFPIKIKGIDILIIAGLMFFLLFIALITHHVSKLENKINSVEQKFKRADDLRDIKKDIEALKLILLKKK